jgi:rRNA maturation endonuclease Nob1
MTQSDLLNTKKKWFICGDCKMVFAEKVAKKNDKKCHSCGGRLRERGE